MRNIVQKSQNRIFRADPEMPCSPKAVRALLFFTPTSKDRSPGSQERETVLGCINSLYTTSEFVLPCQAIRLTLERFLGQEAHLHGKTNRITARPKIQLPGKARSIGLNRLHSHEKLFGDFRTGVTSRHEVEHLQLTAAKEVCPPFGTGF
jgi:hypothetical protein